MIHSFLLRSRWSIEKIWPSSSKRLDAYALVMGPWAGRILGVAVMIGGLLSITGWIGITPYRIILSFYIETILILTCFKSNMERTNAFCWPESSLVVQILVFCQGFAHMACITFRLVFSEAWIWITPTQTQYVSSVLSRCITKQVASFHKACRTINYLESESV